MTTNSLNSVFDRMLSLSRALEQGGDSFAPPSATRGQFWMPPLDVYETESAFVVEADLPGVHPENVEINFEQNTLTLRGTRAPTFQAPERGELRAYSLERTTGAFARSVRLPEYVDGNQIEATYANGVLTVTVPKAQSARPRKIAIKTTESQSQKKLNA